MQFYYVIIFIFIMVFVLAYTKNLCTIVAELFLLKKILKLVEFEILFESSQSSL